MNRVAKIFLLFALGSLFSIVCIAKEHAQKTDKIKIVSACCINDRWIFRVFDGLTGETITITPNKKNAKGFAITDYNQTTQTAEILTPSGNFIITFDEQSPFSTVSISQTEPYPYYEETKTTAAATTHRKQILERIK